jgi:hypothetical protein
MLYQTWNPAALLVSSISWSAPAGAAQERLADPVLLKARYYDNLADALEALIQRSSPGSRLPARSIKPGSTGLFHPRSRKCFTNQVLQHQVDIFHVLDALARDVHVHVYHRSQLPLS